MSAYPITTQREIRRSFWEEHPLAVRRRIDGIYPSDVRCAFCDYVDHLVRSGQISEALAQRVTL